MNRLAQIDRLATDIKSVEDGQFHSRHYARLITTLNYELQCLRQTIAHSTEQITELERIRQLENRLLALQEDAASWTNRREDSSRRLTRREVGE